MKTFKDMQDTRQLEPNDNDTGDTWQFTYFNSYYIGIPSAGGEFHLSMPNKEYFSHNLEYLDCILWADCAYAEMNAICNGDVIKMLEKNLEIDALKFTPQELRRFVKIIRISNSRFTHDELVALKRWIG